MTKKMYHRMATSVPGRTQAARCRHCKRHGKQTILGGGEDWICQVDGKIIKPGDLACEHDYRGPFS